MINVTKSYLPALEQYVDYLKGIWERSHLTNNGPLVNELEEKIKTYLGVKHFFFINNGTVALQIALKALEIKGTVITTPFSYVATTSSIVWENAQPIFTDINPASYTINADKLEAVIKDDTSAILATHVYGIPCDVDKIKEIAERRGLKVIYDAAHAFGVKYKGSSLLNYGNISTLSFHATKLFHTVEGGGICTNDDALAHRVQYMRNFGHKGQEEFWGLGINGKNSELHAAMGLCVLPHVNEIIARRKHLSMLYDECFKQLNMELERPVIDSATEHNFAYYPVVFDGERQLLSVKDSLNASYIYPRRYFYPSLHLLPYLNDQYQLPVCEEISKRVMCLPLYYDLPDEAVKRICGIIYNVLKY